MVNFVQLQNDVAQVLLSAGRLASINVVQYRKLRLQSQVDLSSVYLAGRGANSPSGCGVLVEMPAFTVDKPNIIGPLGILEFTCAVIEEPNLNLTPQTGTLLDAETVAQRVIDELHGMDIAGMVQLWTAPHAILAIQDYDSVCPGTVQYRVAFNMRYNRSQTPRCPIAVPAQEGNTIALACSNPAATIYYTLDGSTPVPPPINPGALVYEAPVPMQSGQTLRARAFAPGLTGSGITMASAS